MSSKVSISEEELQYLKACDYTLHRINKFKVYRKDRHA